MKAFTIHKVLEAAGGVNKLRNLLIRSGQPCPPYSTVNLWRWRGSLPTHWVGPIMWALACKGINPVKLLVDR